MFPIKHYGDILKIDGGAVPIVDVITGGSPCQDLSVAGLRKGLAGERSGLFIEQMRIVKEQRAESEKQLIAAEGENFDRTKIKPRYMVWENVCLSGNTLVTTYNGYKYIKDVEVGEMVRTHDGTYHKVLQTYKTEMQPTIKVKFQGGVIECTPNHPFLTEDLAYKPMGEFKVGDRVGFKVDEPGNKYIGMPIAYAFGRWLADGSVAIRNDRPTKHRIFISTGYKKYESLYAELSKLPWKVNEHKMDWAINFTFSSDEFGELTDSAGYGARNKQVPEWVFNLVAEERAEVLRGYLDGDGYQRVRGENHTECSFTTSSEKLAYGIARLVRDVYHVGVSLSYRAGKGTTIIDGREVSAHDSWYCSFSIPNKYEHNLQGVAGASKYDNGYVWCRIREISEGDVQDVYNLSVEDNNTYEANSVVCHNCGAFSSGQPSGADFQAVLEEIAGVVLNEVPTIPIPEDGWPYAGNLEGVAESGTPFSICWRTHDAQFWGKTILDDRGRVVKAGTPQRRRRIALVADFGGYTAPEILFESESMSRNSEQSCKERQATSGATGKSLKESGTGGVTAICIGNGQVDNAVTPEVELSKTLNCMQDPMKVLVNPNPDGAPIPYKKDSHAKSAEDGQGWVEANVNDTLNAFDQGETRTPTLVVDVAPDTIAIEGNGARDSHKGDGYVESDVMYTLNTVEQHAVCYGFQSQACDMPIMEEAVPTMIAKHASNVVHPQSTEPILLESNQNHATVQTDGVSTTLPASMGEGGGYVPMVVEGFDSYNQAATGEVAKPLTNKATDSDHIPVVYGFEPGAAQRLDPENRFNEEISPTLRAKMGDNQVAVAETTASEAKVYGICSFDSNSMKSDNPESGIYEADTSRTLDLNGGNPACNQGGMMVVQPTSDKPVKESTKAYGVTTKGNGDAFISEERHTALSTGGGEPGQGYPCVLTEQATPVGCLNPWEHQGKHIQSEDGIAETLYAGEARYGGGEAYVLQTKTTYQDTTGALCAAGYSKLGTQEASNDMYVVQDAPVQSMEVFHCTTEEDKAHPLKARDYKDPQIVAINDTGHQNIDDSGVAFTLGARDYKSPQTVAIDMGAGKSQCGVTEEQAPTLTTTHGGEPAVFGFKPDQGSKAQGMGFEEEKAPTLSTCNNAGVLSIENHPNDSRVKIRDDGTVQTLSGRMGTGGNNTPMVLESEKFVPTTLSKPVVRRLTPLECTRLQGFPDGWVDIGDWTDSNGKLHKDSDSAKYKALGNSIALPFWYWMSGRMVNQLKKDGVEQPTMASLFDGISGFPLVFAQHGCTPLWSSEIEEFPIAVAKKHFGDDETGTPGDYEKYINNLTPFYIQNQPSTCLGLDRASFNQGQNAKYDFSVEDNLAQTLVSRGPGG